MIDLIIFGDFDFDFDFEFFCLFGLTDLVEETL